ncbi:MAG: hypothetical protein ABR497_10220 [Kiritimatiellia bacterium]
MKRLKAGLPLTDEGFKEILHLHDLVASYLSIISEAMVRHDPNVLTRANVDGDIITHYMKSCRDRHLARVGTQQASPLTSLIFTDILTNYRKIKDHALNIAETLV